MKIGIDFDNTIACYDDFFRELAEDRDIPIRDGETPKQCIKNAIVSKKNGNLEWSLLQAETYGSKIHSAKVFSGFFEFLDLALSKNHTIKIISHKTLFPSVGERVNLHEAATSWLRDKGLLREGFLSRADCFFETSLQKKVERIKSQNCSYFIDDMEQVLLHPCFPRGTKRILFGKSHSSLTHYSNWKKTASILSQHIDPPPPGPKESQTRLANSLPLEKHKESFEGLLQKKGYSGNFNFRKLKLGGNNCVYQIKTGDAKLLGKVYYRSPDDQRDRLRHEISFTSYLSTQDLHKSFANEIANDTRYGMACFEWVEGKPCENGEEIPEAHWKQCLNFLSAIQKGRNSDLARELPTASEAAFSISQHWSLLQNRHDYWYEQLVNDRVTLPDDLKDFILRDMETLYQELANKVLVHKDFNRVLSFEERILSPSDFGLHNAVVDPKGNLQFIDFEYSGWDDPAKTIADFFCQPKFPPPMHVYDEMKNCICDMIPESKVKYFLERHKVVNQIITLKWCYILLNGIHPMNSKGKAFANEKLDLRNVLSKAKMIINKIWNEQ